MFCVQKSIVEVQTMLMHTNAHQPDEDLQSIVNCMHCNCLMNLSDVFELKLKSYEALNIVKACNAV